MKVRLQEKYENYFNQPEACICVATCDRCGDKDKVCLHTDSSSGEYGGVNLCILCLEAITKQMVEADPADIDFLNQ